jgi:hypothetical protein
MDNINNNHTGDSTDDELNDNPVNSNHSKQHFDSGVEVDQNSSSSTIYNHPTNNDPLFPQTNRTFEETSQPTLIRRVQQQRLFNNENQNEIPITRIHFNSPNSYWNRLKRNWFLSLFIGLFILLGIFTIYLFTLDICSRSTLIHSICHKIIYIDSGKPTI